MPETLKLPSHLWQVESEIQKHRVIWEFFSFMQGLYTWTCGTNLPEKYIFLCYLSMRLTPQILTHTFSLFLLCVSNNGFAFGIRHLYLTRLAPHHPISSLSRSLYMRAFAPFVHNSLSGISVISSEILFSACESTILYSFNTIQQPREQSRRW